MGGLIGDEGERGGELASFEVEDFGWGEVSFGLEKREDRFTGEDAAGGAELAEIRGEEGVEGGRVGAGLWGKELLFEGEEVIGKVHSRIRVTSHIGCYDRSLLRRRLEAD